MEENKNLSERLDDFKSTNTNPQLDWSVIGDSINKGVAERQQQERRRRLLIWLLGTTVLLLLVYVAGSQLLSSDTAYTATNQVTVGTESTTTEDQEIQSVRTQGKTDIAAANESSANRVSTDLQEAAPSVSDETESKAVTTPPSEIISRDQPAVFSNIPVQRTSSDRMEQTLVNTEKEINNTFYSPSAATTITDPSTTSRATLTSQPASSVITAVEATMENTSPASQVLLAECDLLAKPSLAMLDLWPRTLEHPTVALPVSPDQPAAAGWLSVQLWSHITNFEGQYTHAVDDVGLGIEVLGSKAIADRLFLSSGVAYDRYRFRSQFEQSQDVLLYAPMTVDTIFFLDGEEVGNTTTDSIAGISTRSFRHHNSYSYLTIPVQLSYQYSVGRWQVMPVVGGSVAVLRSGSGRLADSNFAVSPVADPRGSRWAYFGQLGLGYSLTDRLDVLVNVRYGNMSFDESRMGVFSSGLQLRGRF